MKRLDMASSLFWLAISSVVLAASLKRGVGNLHDPGAGFIAFGASGLLGIFSIALFIQSISRQKEGPTQVLFSRNWGRIIFVLAVLAVYAVVMPTVGYLISTFVMMILLFWILERKKIGVVLLSAFLTTMLSYLIFSKWLNCQFPNGFFGF